MKKLLLILITALFLLSGCSGNTPAGEPENNPSTPSESPDAQTPPENEPEEESLFEQLPESFTFSSGAGAWSTDLSIQKDGTFSGTFHDADMGDSGEGYPGGTVYLCNFSGKLAQPEKVNDYTYSTKIESIELAQVPEEERYDNDVRYIYSTPYGLEDAGEILIYLPGAKTADLPEGFLNWTHWTDYDPSNPPEELPFYGLYNVDQEEGFVGIIQNSQ